MYWLNNDRSDAQRGSGASRKFAAYSPIRRKGCPGGRASHRPRLRRREVGVARSASPSPNLIRLGQERRDPSIRPQAKTPSLDRGRVRKFLTSRQGADDRRIFQAWRAAVLIGGRWLRVPSVDTDVRQHQLPPEARLALPRLVPPPVGRPAEDSPQPAASSRTKRSCRYPSTGWPGLGTFETQ